MSFFSSTPHFGATSPKPFQMYQPMPAVGTPTFGGLGRPMTPKENSRHSSYSKELEPTIQPIVPSLERPRRSREYYLEGGDIYFLAENYLFRVHKYFFDRESPVFRKQFADSAVSGHHRLGSSDNDPLVLHDVRADDFSRFLWVFYNPIYSIYDATTDDWAAILGLAHYWQFSEVKSLVVRELEKQIIPSIYKIVIYHRYNVERGLLLPSYTDLVSREETLTIDEAKDLGLETSLMIMTAREVVRKGDSLTSAVKVSTDELRNIIRQVFRFPVPRSDSPLSDVTAAEPAQEHRSPQTLAEKTELPTVPEHENERLSFSASASLNSPLPPVDTPATAPIISTPTPPVPAPAPNNQATTKPTPVTPKKNDTKPVVVSPLKEQQKPKDKPAEAASLPKPDGPKQSVPESVQPVTKDQPKPEAQDDKKKPLSSRLADVGKSAGSPTITTAKDATTPKDKDGNKSTDNKGAKDAKDVANTKDASGPLATGQDSTGTPVGTPLLNQDQETPGTPTTGLGEANQSAFGTGRKKKNRGSGGGSQQQQQGQEQGNPSGKPQSPVNNKAGPTFGGWFGNP